MQFRLLFPAISFLFTLPLTSTAQSIYDGTPRDSTVISFDVSSNDSSIRFSTDTNSAHFWQIGNTAKPFFSNSGITRAIMTDTVNSYTLNLNDWFTIDITAGQQFWPFNTIVDFRHKFQTTPNKDGGIVEFSNDNGLTWQNVKGDCNGDQEPGPYNVVLTDNCYGKFDTLENGTPAFSGTSNGWQYTRIQFFVLMPLKSTQPTCDMEDVSLIRFRFSSDSIPEAMDGWIIDNIVIEHDAYEGSISKLNRYHSLEIHPNPCFDGNIFFPVLARQERYRLTITNEFGARIYSGSYLNKINLGTIQKGIYYYHATNGIEEYSGKILTE